MKNIYFFHLFITFYCAVFSVWRRSQWSDCREGGRNASRDGPRRSDGSSHDSECNSSASVARGLSAGIVRTTRLRLDVYWSNYVFSLSFVPQPCSAQTCPKQPTPKSDFKLNVKVIGKRNSVYFIFGWFYCRFSTTLRHYGWFWIKEQHFIRRIDYGRPDSKKFPASGWSPKPYLRVKALTSK